MVRDPDKHAEKLNKAHSVFIRLVLPPYTIHFKSSTYMRDSTLTLLDTKVCKETLKTTASNATVRSAIGTDPNFWTDFAGLLRAAIPSLERRSFTIWDPSSVDYESTSGALIASHYPGLWQDLERLNDLMSISRNCLPVGPEAQDLAAESGVDTEVFRLINCCVRVTARGYDGEAGTGEEEKWQWIVNAYKKLLITSLQFLNNLVAQNERRKLMLWVSLFDHASPIDGSGENGLLDPDDQTNHHVSSGTHEPPVDDEDILLAYGTNGKETLDLAGAERLYSDAKKHKSEILQPEPVPDWIEQNAKDGRLGGNGYVLFCKTVCEDVIEDFLSLHGREPTKAELHLEFPRRWSRELRPETRESWMSRYEELERKYRADVAAWEAKQLVAQSLAQTATSVSGQGREIESELATLESELADRIKNDIIPVDTFQPPTYSSDGAMQFPSSTSPESGNRSVIPDDMKMLFTADAGARILESGKAELLKRLEGYAPPMQPRDSSKAYADFAVRVARSDPAINPEERMRSRSRSPLSGGTSKEPSTEVRPHEYLPPGGVIGDEIEGASGDELDGEEEEDEEEDEGEESEEDESDEAEDDEEDYPGSTEDGRGLLTDVPLILGPSEIEVLPMLIMSGIVAPPPGSPGSPPTLSGDERNTLTNMHTVRTHLLLSQSNGRNLLRELLIFVAAWDLREEELYFKFMVKIMEAILKNGLMPYAYHAFRDRSRSKDIISPAQAVIMKLLTCIFRGRGEASKVATGVRDEHGNAGSGKDIKVGKADEKERLRTAQAPNRVDLHILNFIFTEFRQHIIPQTCALLFLQGQIHAGRASPDDFPLNLWDMERMYEGVYQYLEFFAVLTEDGVWKCILGEWEMASELVTLLRELEGGVEKKPDAAVGGVDYGKLESMDSRPSKLESQNGLPQQRSTSADAAIPGTQVSGSTSAASVTVERPFEIDPPPAAPTTEELTLPPLPLPPPAPGSNDNRIFEPETPLAYPEEPIIPPLTPHHHTTSTDTSLSLQPLVSAPPPLHATTADQDEPSDFEWRNLKKLTVLVLSSLVWKNRSVQDQVRKYGGLEALVSCCRHDEHNPYIREHAIMCLRFAVEGCEENAEVIRKMAANGHSGLSSQLRGGAGGDGEQHQQQSELLLQGGSLTLSAAEDVPKEVLNHSGYESFMDGKGQVGLRRKDGGASLTGPQQTVVYGPVVAGSLSSADSSGSAAAKPPRLSATKMTAEKAAELMQNALRDLPLGDKLVTDKQKAEALAKLDRAFESTEKVLGRGQKGGAKGKGGGSAGA